MAQDPAKPQGAAEPSAPDNVTREGPASGTIDIEQLRQILQALATGGGVPITVKQSTPVAVGRLVEAMASRPPAELWSILVYGIRRRLFPRLLERARRCETSRPR
jgi:hypothetical protein